MGLISDIKLAFSFGSESIRTFNITPYLGSKNSLTSTIKLYCLDSFTFEQINKVATKTIEQGNFTVDSKQLSAPTITIRGMCLPTDTSLIQTRSQLVNAVSTILQNLRTQVNGVSLFSINDPLTFGLYEPLALESVRQLGDIDNTIPEVSLTFKQVQVATSSTYAKVQVTQNTAEPQFQGVQ